MGGGCISGFSWTETLVEGRGVDGGQSGEFSPSPTQGASRGGTARLRLQMFWNFGQDPLSSHPFTQDGFLRPLFAVCTSAQFRPTLCDPMDGRPAGSSIRGLSPRQQYWSGLSSPSLRLKRDSSGWDYGHVIKISTLT